MGDETIDLRRGYSLTLHARQRMSGRSISPDAIRLVLDIGRTARVRGATIYAVGRKEVERYRQEGIELSSVEGIQVVCNEAGAILTVYRNKDLRGLRPRSRRTCRRHAT